MAMYLVRHASAGVRNDSDPCDGDRPLDPTGAEQAVHLCEWLRHESPTLVVSSPLLRCRQTVEPLAAALDLDVAVDDRLAEGTDLDRAWELVTSTAAGSAVLCSHGDLIPEIISRCQRRGMVIPGKSGCSKGSVWILSHWDGTTFATGTYTPVKV